MFDVKFLFLFYLLSIFAEIRSIDVSQGIAEKGQFPSTVAILIQYRQRWRIEGTGTLLSPYYVLGSRLRYFDENDGRIELMKIIAGSSRWDLIDEEAQWQYVDHMFSRYTYGFEHIGVPLELYRMSAPFHESNTVKFAKINYDIAPIEPGTPVKVAGFGGMLLKNWWFSRSLAWSQFNIASNERCEAYMPFIDHFCLHDENIPNKKFCSYDNGAPIYLKDEIIGTAALIGQYKFCYKTAIRFGLYREWIEKSMAWDGKSPNSRAYSPTHYKREVEDDEEEGIQTRRLRSLKSSATSNTRSIPFYVYAKLFVVFILS